jgi:hypothetical protein
VPRKILAFLSDKLNRLPQPTPNLWTIHVIIVNPLLAPGVIGRVYVDALDFARVVGQQVVSLYEQIARVRVSGRKLAVTAQEVIRS